MSTFSPEGLQVRPATLDDLAALLPLFLAYRAFYEVPPEPARSALFLRQCITTGQAAIWLAWREGQALGFCLCYPSHCSLLMAPILVLNDLFTRPQARGQGVGAALMQAAQAHALRTGVRRMDLETAHGNETAQALYRAQGWSQEMAFRVFNKHLPADGEAV